MSFPRRHEWEGAVVLDELQVLQVDQNLEIFELGEVRGLEIDSGILHQQDSLKNGVITL